MDVREFERLRKTVENLKAELARGEGKLQQVLDRLRDEFGFTSLEEAEAELTSLRKELERDQKEYERDLAKWRKRWGDR